MESWPSSRMTCKIRSKSFKISCLSDQVLLLLFRCTNFWCTPDGKFFKILGLQWPDHKAERRLFVFFKVCLDSQSSQQQRKQHVATASGARKANVCRILTLREATAWSKTIRRDARKWRMRRDSPTFAATSTRAYAASFATRQRESSSRLTHIKCGWRRTRSTIWSTWTRRPRWNARTSYGVKFIWAITLPR